VHLPTPHLDAVLDEHGPYADESAVYRAALADGYGPLGAEAYLAEWVAARDHEFALEQAAELAAERGMSEWAEGSGFDAEAQEDLRRHEALWPHGYGVDPEPGAAPMRDDRC
jgi:hypothetical protein